MILSGFSALDTLTGGLEEGKSYLLYGDVGTGKTTFSLQFLYQGLLNGETVALVTRRSAHDVFEQGLAFNMDLEPFARNEHLLIFEYTPQVIENAMRLKEHDDIAKEILYLLGEESVSRLAFDPISPLLASPSSAVSIFRARSLVQAFAQLEATTLYVIDTPEGEDYLSNVKDFVYGTLRLETGEGGNGVLAIERFPGIKGHRPQINYEITHGAGMVELRATGAAGEAVQRKILVIEPNRDERENLRALLGKEYNLIMAEDATDGLAKLAAAPPDMLLVDKDAGELDGVGICRKLRENRMNLPIVLISDQTRRTRDRVDIMAAGADECLIRPLDGRILKLKVHNLLRRYEGVRDRYLTAPIDSAVSTAMERDRTTNTTNLAYFFERVRQEIAYSTENGLSFAVLVIHAPPEASRAQDMRDVAARLIREYDLLYSDKDRVAVLLAEADETGVKAYLSRFSTQWPQLPAPKVASRCFARQPDFLQSARSLMDLATGTRAATTDTRA